ncbi:hypothetical protein BDV96DRAFT_599668 [Lophiotrema nucula]|uniref:Uncharacterized protein n=1 Tax=Lophiotrema nucula TaxID=690887 RepID=A0A6A5ZA86_9PLEO|nr:hypothetical protein BDV96DRAFT_599668 [Lophiotrema nucula]
MAACVSCQQPLVLEVGSDDEEEDVQGQASSSGKAPATEPETVPDDVDLNCGCHFHWTCLLEAYQVTECPNCGKNIASNAADSTLQILCNLNNEGGYQENLDILPLLTEEGYLKAYPEERKCRAFLEFCREGDFKAIVAMLQDDEDDEEEEGVEEDGLQHRKIGPEELLRYQDAIGEMQSGLHAAVQGGSREVAWLLLLLASKLDLQEFPAIIFQEAASLGVMRPDMEGKSDIRSLKDANGKTADDLAREIGGVWNGWPGSGRLSV